MKHIALGASLYVPATHHNLVSIANGTRLPELRSVIFCTEDSVGESNVEAALHNLATALPLFRATQTLRFVRVRNPIILQRLLCMNGIEAIEGFVLPKITRKNLDGYLRLLPDCGGHTLMLTLETAEVFDQHEMKLLRIFLESESIRSRILALRIGGNDLLNHLGTRRSTKRTLYDSPIGPVVSMLAGVFLPHGFPLTAPVFEGLAHNDLLLEEVERDLEHGLAGKTAIHPSQVPIIESVYQVSRSDYEMAERMLRQDSPAVFKMHRVMCEGATHLRWARTIIERAAVFGLKRESLPGNHRVPENLWELNSHDPVESNAICT